MVKVYYSYEFSQPYAQIISKSSNFVYYPPKKTFISGVNQYVAIISSKSGQVQKYLYKQNKNIPVRCVKVSGGKIYAGYEDGQIIVWDIETFEELFSFNFHKKTVSAISIFQSEQKMISASLDGSIIIWDLLSQECSQIKSAHNNSITAIEIATVLYKGNPTPVIVSIGKDGFFKVWNLQNSICLAVISCHATQALSLYLDRQTGIFYVGTNKQDLIEIQLVEENQEFGRVKGLFKRNNLGSCLSIKVEGKMMYMLNSNRSIECYEMLKGKEGEERKKKLQRKHKETEKVQNAISSQYKLKFIEQKAIPFKVYGFQLHKTHLYLNNGSNICELSNNQEITKGSGRTNQLELQYPFIAQRAQQNISIYNHANMNKLYTINVKASSCSLFSNGYILIVEGNQVSIWDLSKNEQVFSMQEKWSGCWIRKSKCLLWRQNQLGFFQVGYNKQKQIKMKSEGKKLFEDKITLASYKHNMDKYIVCLQNSQLYVEYSDSRKNFLKLYGHKMPVLSYDIASDDALLASGSVDKDIRLWDMDFGHSIKTIFAHQQPITVVKFVPSTHYLLSGSKDGHIKYWDCDTYQLVMDLSESLLQIKSIGVTSGGDYIIGGGLDDGFRVWKQTNNQIIASDTQEEQLQKVMMEDYAKEKLDKKDEKVMYQDLKHGQQIIQALENSQKPKTLVHLLRKISPANLKSTLSFLHSTHVNKLVQYLQMMIENEYECELCWRVMYALNRGSSMGQMMKESWKSLSRSIRMNKEGMKMVVKAIEEEGSII